MRVASNIVEALLAKYHIHAPVTDERYLHHADVSRGVPLHIVCLNDPVLGKQIIVSSNRRRWPAACPLCADDADKLVDQLRQAGVLPSYPQMLDTVQHLLVRCSQLFDEQDLQRLRLAPVYVRRNGYRVGGAAMSSRSQISAVQRLQPHAHDTGAVFTRRPTVRQKYDRTTGSQT